MKMLLVFAVFAMLSTTPISGGIFDGIKTSFRLVCITMNMDKVEACYSHLPPGLYTDLKKNDEKNICCTVVAIRDCVERVARKHCGKKSTEVADSIMSGFKIGSELAVNKCSEYNNVFDCMDPVLRIFIVMIMVFVLAALGFCCCCCCLMG